MKKNFQDLENYGIIGNLETCALVGSNGSIDWLCFPYIESPSVFASLLDTERGGFFRIAPAEKYSSIQAYEKNTNVIKTIFQTYSGYVSVTDFMPLKEKDSSSPITTLFRKVEFPENCRARLQVEFAPVFNYAQGKPSLRKAGKGIIAEYASETLYLQCDTPLSINAGSAKGIILPDCKPVWFILQYNNEKPVSVSECEKALLKTIGYWRNWVHSCRQKNCAFKGPWHDLVVRSGLILKLLISENGAIAAAPTTSLPEVPGGVRNWDYRFAWVRDSSFLIRALYHLGHRKEAIEFREWIRSVLEEAKDPNTMMVLYPLHGGPISEKILKNLSGYRDSGPVRVGNVAYEQTQFGIYGEFLDAVFETSNFGEEIPGQYWRLLRPIVDHVCGIWDKKDSGIWEDRVSPQHFVYSKVMCWVALDRGIKIAARHKFDAPVKKWRAVADEIKEAVLEKGFSTKLNSFVRTFGSEDLDASSLKISLSGFLPAKDKRVQGTIDAIMKHLMTDDGLLLRYRIDDGLAGKEGNFVLCSFWLVSALALSGRRDEAKEVFTRVLRYASPLGLFSEEIDRDTGKLIGNMPQALSHIGLINAALHLGGQST